TRELSRLYEHYKKSNRLVRDRIIANPALFAKAVLQRDQERDAKQVNEGPEGKWLKDITIVCHILRRLLNTAEYVFYPEQNPLQHRQRQTWLTKAEKMIHELKERAGRKSDDNAGLSGDNPGDGHQGCGTP
ncbi:MAG: hypothetical protein JRF02_01565, partial [Deltaproteobacteria bacterium]|nr:hypothetical protein [Deltaproteobacteria bacterium]